MYAVTLVPAIWSGWNLICLRKKENPKEGTRIRNIHAENNHLICVFFFLNKNCIFLLDQLNLFQILIYLVIFTSKKEKKKDKPDHRWKNCGLITCAFLFSFRFLVIRYIASHATDTCRRHRKAQKEMLKYPYQRYHST